MQYDDISQLPPKYQEQVRRKLGKAFAGTTAEGLEQTLKSAMSGFENANQPKKKSKYHSEMVEVDGIRFDSRKEARRFLELREMEKRGEISDLRLQVNFTLIEGHTKPNGERVRPEIYRADFTYRKQDGAGNYTIYIVEDVKSAGTRTEKYKIKKKQMWEKFHLEITEV